MCSHALCVVRVVGCTRGTCLPLATGTVLLARSVDTLHISRADGKGRWCCCCWCWCRRCCDRWCWRWCRRRRCALHTLCVVCVVHSTGRTCLLLAAGRVLHTRNVHAVHSLRAHNRRCRRCGRHRSRHRCCWHRHRRAATTREHGVNHVEEAVRRVTHIPHTQNDVVSLACRHVAGVLVKCRWLCHPPVHNTEGCSLKRCPCQRCRHIPPHTRDVVLVVFRHVVHKKLPRKLRWPRRHRNPLPACRRLHVQLREARVSTSCRNRPVCRPPVRTLHAVGLPDDLPAVCVAPCLAELHT